MDAIVEHTVNLESLDITSNSSMITDFRNTEKLRGMTKLKDLDISYCHFGDSKLVSICKYLPAVESLNLEGCDKISLEGLSEVLLNQHTNIRRMGLAKTEPTKWNQPELKLIEEKRPELELVYHHE